MNVTIQPSYLSGTCQAPASKSITQRALAIALIRRGITVLHHSGQSEDEQAALTILQQAGCHITQSGTTLIIDSAQAHTRLDSISFGESGLAARMFTPLLAIQPQELILTGHGSLPGRSMHFLSELLPQLGVQILAGKDHLPLTIKGPLRPKNITVNGSLSSQFITGLLLAYTAAGAHDTTIRVNNLVSKPYLALTLRVMQDMQLPLPQHDAGFEFFNFKLQNIPDHKISYTVESDWSSAAFLLAAGAVAGDVTVKGLDVFSEQGDKTVMQAIMESTARMSISTEEIRVQKGLLKPFHFNATDHPDLFPPLAAMAAFCHGTSVIEGVHRLQHKESNRAVTLQEELGKMGIQITFQDDMMLIKGNEPVHGARVHARGDHRIAMACAIAALRATGDTIIEGAQAVNKSWPGFFTDLQHLGATISIS